jgi:hypothetical protein
MPGVGCTGRSGRHPSECAERDRKAVLATVPIGAASGEPIADLFADPDRPPVAAEGRLARYGPMAPKMIDA